ncbi:MULTISPECIES: ABC transporter ATP-binding protein [unclassified Clostridioides]|uniref:ABC transporter ATP-binding protein n=1 Tax=unclassified Clostridioides TaxID=2635829 RepID=UPI001D0BF51A|nr:ABC transporter ATP-binding protein [Clostridioides sp. ES-S-0049-03]MCC0652484.1 ABC transporter ATP-binding protein [Clostridioides sp. ES-S-0001-03]MCC0655155.1 ABC transporter ATP-binding protein [Clostridioides sp. ES-S-0123-01]MCC0675069.1 ABC transporter ATP-binding protein [Clostridioides sp. ES-W-0018-02]MCC0702227.1 ABC transporter ATP-binding protein [Clostridioides sp. ES-S-0049-02]MCC0710120.1 ABC transporter ATP-binding protein [Clostridioides sp. ES-W-0017-02]UDN60101.1 ABC 
MIIMDAITIKNLNKVYKNFALQDVSFSVPKGSIMGFVGENGAGKTTTLKSILNLISYDSGNIEIFGLDNIKNEKEIKEQIGVVFEGSNFHENLNTNNISKIMSHIYKNWDDRLFKEYLKQLRVPNNKLIKEFSKGNKMKLSIAVALSHKPKLLILDEATSSLDPIVREEILDIFLDFIQDEEHSIILSSHITSDLDKIADYITFIHKGKIVFSESKDELIDTMGILKCNSNDFAKLTNEDYSYYRKSQFGYEVLLKDKYKFITKHPNLIVDNTSIEEIMLFYVRGDK